MKKTYEKPMLLAESFELVEHVSSGCKIGNGAYANYITADDCAYFSDDISVYRSDGACNLDWIDSDDDSVELSNPSTWPLPQCYNGFMDGLSSAFVS